MQRRSFLKNAACIGACAGLATAAPRAFAAARAKPLALTLLKVDTKGNCVNAASCAPYQGDVQVRASAHWKDASLQRVDMRAWFAADSGSAAFDFASVGGNGASSNLRFATRAERLASFEVRSANSDTRGTSGAQCLTTSWGGGYLAPGNYWLVLHRGGSLVNRPEQSEVVARVRLDVSPLTA